jgi:four helix bundle protein
MTKITRFEDLDCWREARFLVKKIYEVTKKNNFSKDFRLVGQIQGAVVSIMANIAEGFIRKSDKEFV